MGFCGCTLQTSSITAAVFGFLQSVLGIILAAVLIKEFEPTYKSFGSRWRDDYGCLPCQAICGVHIAVNVLWFVSCILLVIGISKDHVKFHRQWTITTSVVHTTDAILFIVGCMQFKTEYWLVENLIFLLLMLSRFAIIGYACDIFLAIYVNQRASEILRGPSAPQQPVTTIIVVGGQSTGQQMIPISQVAGFPGQNVQVVYIPQPMPSNDAYEGQSSQGNPPPYLQGQPTQPVTQVYFQKPMENPGTFEIATQGLLSQYVQGVPYTGK